MLFLATRRHFTHLLLILAALPLLAPIAAAAEPAGVRYSLFNGQDLTGWHVTGCTVEAEAGILRAVDGDGFARTDHPYRDFIIEFSWRPLRTEQYDSGVYFRSELPREGERWPKRHQINLKQGDEGNLIGFPKGRSKGLVNPSGWNAFKLTVIGGAARMEINGQKAWEVEGIKESEGYVGIQVEVTEGGEHEFKDLAITELGHRSLFDGKTLAGWEPAAADEGNCWEVSEGLLHCTGQKGPWLRSAEEFGDFNLRFEYRLSPGGNSGVYVRVPKSGAHHGKNAGVEIQLLDDASPRYAKLQAYQYSGSIYAVVPADPRVARAAGEWNTMEIDTAGGRYRVVHNGVVVVEADEETHPPLAERLRRGYLGLQNHSTPVWFRNLRIAEVSEPAEKEPANSKPATSGER